METLSVTVKVNGQEHTADVEPRMHLGDFLRTVARKTGTHLGCEHGVCGACTVQIDGVPARSCLTLAVQAEGCDIRTVEGLGGADGALNVLQESFRAHHGLQCGYCTPGILMSLDVLIRNNPDASEAEIRDCLSGHLCRCTGYASIMKAAVAAVEEARGRPADV